MPGSDQPGFQALGRGRVQRLCQQPGLALDQLVGQRRLARQADTGFGAELVGDQQFRSELQAQRPAGFQAEPARLPPPASFSSVRSAVRSTSRAWASPPAA